MSNDTDLRCYIVDDNDCFVAHSIEDVWELWVETYGETYEGMVGWPPEDGTVVVVPMDRVLSITDDNGPCDSGPVKRTVREWINENGRGYLCSY